LNDDHDPRLTLIWCYVYDTKELEKEKNDIERFPALVLVMDLYGR